MARLPQGVQARERKGAEGKPRKQYRAWVTDKSKRLESGRFARMASKWFDRLGDATAWRDATLDALAVHDGAEVDRAASVEDVCRRWISAMERGGVLGRGKVKDSTRNRYGRSVDLVIVPTIGELVASALRPQDIRLWIDERAEQDGNDEAHRALSCIRQAFEYAAQTGRLGVNVAASIRIAKTGGDDGDGKAVRTFLQPDEVKCLLDTADALADGSGGRGGGQRKKAWRRYRPMAYFLFGTGVRIGEALALRWRDVDLEKGLVSILATVDDDGKVTTPKTASSIRTLRIGDELRGILLEHRDRAGANRDHFVFGSSSPLDRSNAANRMWAVLLEAAGIEDFSFHDTRHYHASALIAAGMSDVEVSRRLGHANVGITRSIYLHAFHAAEAAREAKAVELEGQILGR